MRNSDHSCCFVIDKDFQAGIPIEITASSLAKDFKMEIGSRALFYASQLILSLNSCDCPFFGLLKRAKALK